LSFKLYVNDTKKFSILYSYTSIYISHTEIGCKNSNAAAATAI